MSYELHFECCGATVPLGSDRTVGHHDQHCLVCDTPKPATTVKEVTDA